MAKILVADDNSNIQRMVGLALKDQGIDVVAVGNGEAAVRKISELRPDLVLADVFMPVRNGYEVCQYVKEDPSLAHIPVILLVGAFDPLDEQEAQRVGADGVLKKPFVPPDPLIAMVKAALQRAGVSLTPGGAVKAAASAPERKATDLLPHAPPQHAAPLQAPPPVPPTSPLAGISFSSAPAPFAPVVGDEKFVDEPAAPEPVRVDASKHTLAFGNLLGATTTEEDPGFAADAEIPKSGDWRSMDEEPDDVPEENEEETPEAAPSWRRDGADTVFTDDGSGVKDWRDSAVVDKVGRQSARETWEQSSKTSGFESAEEVPTEVPAGVATEMGALASEMSALEAESVAASSRTEEVAESPAEAAQQDPLHEDSSQQQNQVSGAPSGLSLSETSLENTRSTTQETPGYVNGESSGAEHGEEQQAEQPEMAAEETVVADEEVAASKTPEHEAQQPGKHSEPELVEAATRTEEKLPEPVAVNNWLSRPASPWDSDAQKKGPLTSTWDAPSHFAATTESAATQESQDTRATNGQSSHQDVAAVISDEPATQPVAASAEKTSEVDMDALVARVLARMSPDVMQTLTRELLKPMVAALVEDELKKK